MNNSDAEVFKKNPKVDQKVVSAIEALEKKLPDTEKPKQGSDYKLSPPLGGQSLTIVRGGKRT